MLSNLAPDQLVVAFSYTSLPQPLVAILVLSHPFIWSCYNVTHCEVVRWSHSQSVTKILTALMLARWLESLDPQLSNGGGRGWFIWFFFSFVSFGWNGSKQGFGRLIFLIELFVLFHLEQCIEPLRIWDIKNPAKWVPPPPFAYNWDFR